MRSGLLLLIAACSAAQDQQTIRVNTQLVEVDVVVRGHGGPIADLKKDDFTLFDNGKEQKVAFFSVQNPAARDAAKISPLPAGVVSNRINRAGSETAGATVLLWDALNSEMQDQAWVRNQVMKYLQTMRPGDPVAVYLLTKSLKVVQDFTGDPSRLIQAMAHTGAEQSADLSAPDLTDLVSQIDNPLLAADAAQAASLAAMQDLAQATAAEMTDYAMRDRVYVTKAALQAIAEHLSGMPGRKKLAWISGSFPAYTLDQRNRVGATQIEIQDFGPQINESIRALNAANVAVYPIDPRALNTGFSMAKPAGDPRKPGVPGVTEATPAGLTLTGLDTMNLLASGTGGHAYYGTNDLVGVMKDVIEDDQVSYRLAFYPSDGKLDGSYHNLGVKVARKGSAKVDEVRFRKGYYAMDTKTYSNGLWREELNELMLNPLEATRLGMRVSAAPVPTPKGVYNLEVTLDLEDLHLEKVKDRWVANIAFGTMLSPSASTKGTLETIRLSLTEDRLRAGLQNGYRLRRKVVLSDFSGTMRVAIEDISTGAIGSVRVPVGAQ